MTHLLLRRFSYPFFNFKFIRSIFLYNRWESTRQLRQQLHFPNITEIYASRRARFLHKNCESTNYVIREISRTLLLLWFLCFYTWSSLSFLTCVLNVTVKVPLDEYKIHHYFFAHSFRNWPLGFLHGASHLLSPRSFRSPGRKVAWVKKNLVTGTNMLFGYK